MNQGVLYISYDGMLEPLGQSQVLAYLERLAPRRRIHLISYEKAQDWRDSSRREAMKRRMSEAGIGWHPLRYHKTPTAPATAFDVAVGTARAIALVRRHRLGIVHARSYVTALIALAVKRSCRARFLFDMRGLWADERVDGGLWPPKGRLYRLAKSLELHFLEAADHVVTLTHASEVEIRRFPYMSRRPKPITVVPTCANLDRFNIQGPPARSPFVLGYVGSVGTWYLLDEMLRFFQLLRVERPDARLLVINRNEQGLIGDRAMAQGIERELIELRQSEHHEVPRQIGRMSAGMALIKPSYSKIASAPTKLAEYLGCGVPCLGNAGVGDMVEILEGGQVGVALPGFTDEQMRIGARKLLALTEQGGLQQRCRKLAEERFSLDAGVAAYQEIYRSLERQA